MSMRWGVLAVLAGTLGSSLLAGEGNAEAAKAIEQIEARRAAKAEAEAKAAAAAVRSEGAGWKVETRQGAGASIVLPGGAAGGNVIVIQEGLEDKD